MMSHFLSTAETLRRPIKCFFSFLFPSGSFLALSFHIIFHCNIFEGEKGIRAGYKGLKKMHEPQAHTATATGEKWQAWYMFAVPMNVALFSDSRSPQFQREAWEPIKSHKSLSSHVNILLQNSIMVVWGHKTSFVFDVPHSFPHKADIASRKVNKVMG